MNVVFHDDHYPVEEHGRELFALSCDSYIGGTGTVVVGHPNSRFDDGEVHWDEEWLRIHGKDFLRSNPDILGGISAVMEHEQITARQKYYVLNVIHHILGQELQYWEERMELEYARRLKLQRKYIARWHGVVKSRRESRPQKESPQEVVAQAPPKVAPSRLPRNLLPHVGPPDARGQNYKQATPQFATTQHATAQP